MSSDLDVDLELKQFLQKNGGKAVTFKALHAAIEDNIDGFMKVLKVAFQKHADARLELEKRVAELEARPMPKYQGVHRDGDNYKANAMVTKAGSLWFATADTTSTPGTGSAWRLIVKRGEAR